MNDFVTQQDLDDAAADAPGDAPHPYYFIDPYPQDTSLLAIIVVNGDPGA